jgi:hypothetical protein
MYLLFIADKLGNILCAHEISMYILYILTNKIHKKNLKNHIFSFDRTPYMYKVSNSNS